MLLLLGLLVYVIAKYPTILLYTLLTIAIGAIIYTIYGLIYIYLEGKEEDPFLF